MVTQEQHVLSLFYLSRHTLKYFRGFMKGVEEDGGNNQSSNSLQIAALYKEHYTGNGD